MKQKLADHTTLIYHNDSDPILQNEDLLWIARLICTCWSVVTDPTTWDYTMMWRRLFITIVGRGAKYTRTNTGETSLWKGFAGRSRIGEALLKRKKRPQKEIFFIWKSRWNLLSYFEVAGSPLTPLTLIKSEKNAMKINKMKLLSCLRFYLVTKSDSDAIRSSVPTLQRNTVWIQSCCPWNSKWRAAFVLNYFGVRVLSLLSKNKRREQVICYYNGFQQSYQISWSRSLWWWTHH